MGEGGQVLMVFLMLIGGSPGSTAGGLKTTTLAVLTERHFLYLYMKSMFISLEEGSQMKR